MRGRQVLGTAHRRHRREICGRGFAPRAHARTGNPECFGNALIGSRPFLTLNRRDITGLLPFAASDVLRNRRRTISAILGVLLAVTFVAGTFIAIDSSARATLDASLDGIPGDFTIYVNLNPGIPYNYTALEDAILASAGITDVSLYRYLPITSIENGSSSGFPYGPGVTTYAINPARPPLILKGATVEGSLALPHQSVGLTREYADAIEVGINDTVLAVVQFSETDRQTANLTVRALLDVPTGSLGFDVRPPGPPYYYGSFAVVNLNDAEWLLTELNQTGFGAQITGEVWIDRAHYVNPYDVEATRRSLLRIERRLEGIIGPNGFVSDNILGRIQGFTDRIVFQRLQFLLLSTPVLLLGVYLGAIGVDLSHAERRRELAVLKTRGASRGQVIGLLLLEAVVGGLVAAVIGLIAGVGLSRFLLGAVNPGGSQPLPYDAFILTPDTVIAVGVLSMLLMGAVSYRSAKRTASLPIVETLHYYAPGETKINYNPRTDIALVSIGIADYVLVAWRVGAPTSLWTFLLGFVPFLILPFVPLLLIIGLTRIMTRSSGRVYDWFSRAAKPFTKELYYIIRRNLMRNPRRSSNVAIIIALGLAFGVFSLSIIATNTAHGVREIRASIGADMAVTAANPRHDLTTNLSAAAGVAGVSDVLTLTQVLNAYSGTIFAIDPASYFSVAQPEDWYFPGGSAQRGREILDTTRQILVSRSLADQAAVEVGDRTALYLPVYDENGSYIDTIQENVTVGGIVSYLPGVGYGPFQAALYASPTTLQRFIDARDSSFDPYNQDRYLVDIAEDADWREVKAALLQVENVFTVTVTAEVLESQGSDPFSRAVYGFVAMEIAFIVVILTAGVGLILFAASLERDVEFAAIIARGSSGWQTAKLLVGEAFVIMLVGLTVGAGVGGGTAFIATQWLATGPAGVPTSAVPYFFVFPWEAFLLVFLAPAAMMGSALLISTRITRMNVAKVLKIRGG